VVGIVTTSTVLFTVLFGESPTIISWFKLAPEVMHKVHLARAILVANEP
jgi:hypothetical protein